MLCRKCGNELKMGAKFCYSCGYYVDEDEDYDDDEEEGSKKKKKKKNGEPKLSFKEKMAKRKEEKQLAKEAKLRQKEIEAEEKEREKMAAEYEKEQKIKEFYKKEQEAKLRAERRAKAQEEREREKELERQRQIEDSYNQRKSQFDDELNQKMNSHIVDEDDDNENANFSYGTESLINRSPGLGIEESEAPVHNKDEVDLSFDDFNVENRYKKIAGEVKSANSSKNTSLDLSYDEYKETNKKKKKSLKSELSKYSVVIISSVISFVVIFALVYTITNSMNNKDPEPTTPVIVEDITVLLGNCTISIPGNLNYNVEGNNLYVAYDNFTLSFTISKDNYENYSSDLTKLSKDFEKRNYTVSSSDKRDVNGKEFIVYKIIVNGSSKYFYLTQVKSSHVAMGMIEMSGSASVEEALQAIATIVFSVKM
ncbi:MAG: zinc ribbon domain-containing protein [Bacilli bacterium]|nr:zinc ribbon domain-containing protein [Bacilli bacterium]